MRASRDINIKSSIYEHSIRYLYMMKCCAPLQSTPAAELTSPFPPPIRSLLLSVMDRMPTEPMRIPRP